LHSATIHFTAAFRITHLHGEEATMRRRNCSLTESLEPRLVLSSLSPRGNVDAPRESTSDSEPREDFTVTTRERDTATPQRQSRDSEQTDTPVADDGAFVLVDSSESGTGTGATEVRSDNEGQSAEESNVRTVSSDGGTVNDDLAGDSLSTDVRTSVLVDSVADADGTRADDESDAEDRVEDIATRIDSSSESPPVSSSESGSNVLAGSSKNVRVAAVVRSIPAHAERTTLPPVWNASSVSETVPDVDVASWIASLTESLKSWLNFEGLGSGTANTMFDSSAPYMALAGGFSLVAVGRTGFTDADVFEADDQSVGQWKSDRRSGRVTDRRRFHWFGFASKDRRNRPSGEVSQERPSLKQNLSQPDISEAFVMSLIHSVSDDAFVLSPMPTGDELPNDDSEDSSLSLELVTAGVATVAGGAYFRRSQNGKRQTFVRPNIDYSGTTLPRS
jgi:hypothetical protein